MDQSSSKENSTGRKLSGAEDFFHIMHYNFKSILSASFRVESDKTVDFNHIEKAFLLVSERHPLLRMKILVSTVEGENKYYFSEIENFLPSITVIDRPSEDWIVCLEENLLQPLDLKNESLWNVRVLNEKKLSTSFSRVLILNFHPAIADGKSLVTFCLEVTNIIQNFQQGVTMTIESHPLMPSLHKQLGQKIKNNWAAKMVVPFLINSYLFQMLRGRNDNMYFAHHPPISEKNKSIERRTKILPFKLEEDETLRIQTLCERHNVSYEGFINAVCARAITSLLVPQPDVNKNKRKISSGCILDMRKRLMVTDAYVCCGSFVSRVPCMLVVNGIGDSSCFWSTAEESTRQIDKCLADELDLANFKMLDLIGSKKEQLIIREVKSTREGRLGSDMFASAYCGKHSSSETVRIKEMYMAAAEQEVGQVFANNVFIINNCLCWTMVYFSNISEKSHAELLFSKVLEEIHFASK